MELRGRMIFVATLFVLTLVTVAWRWNHSGSYDWEMRSEALRQWASKLERQRHRMESYSFAVGGTLYVIATAEFECHPNTVDYGGSPVFPEGFFLCPLQLRVQTIEEAVAAIRQHNDSL